MAQALFMGEEWRAVRGVFLAVDELGRVLGRRVVGVVEGVGRLGEGIDDAGTLPGVRELGAGELGNGQGRRGGTLITAAGSARDEVGSDGVQDDDGGGEDEGGGVVLGAAGGNVDLARIT